tara:strand:+ start:1913 stop:3586 length:1674 start_codon:yes stop_codon:yes gene_type:complete
VDARSLGADRGVTANLASTSVYGAFTHTAADYPAHDFLYVPTSVAQEYAIAPGAIQYRAFRDEVERHIERYAAAGYGCGHRVGLMLDNRPAFIAHWFALNALGASVVPINAELGAAEHAYLLNLSELCLLVAVPQHRPVAEAAIAAAGRAIACVDAAAQTLPDAPFPAGTEPLSAATECAMLFTSGSTGQPKACLLSNDYFLEMGRWYRDIGGLCTLEAGRERLLTPLPLTHMNAMATSLMGMVATGGCLIQLDRFHASSWWRTVRESAPTVIHYLGVMPAILLQLEPGDEELNPSIKFGFGAGVNPAHHAVFEQRFGFPLTEAWAMTETGAGGCIAANTEPRHVGRACFGKPDPARLEVRLVDEAGKDVPPGEPGELLVRAAGADPQKGFFSGYYRNDAATAEGWAGGWWHTGDVVCFLDDGSLTFVDRRKNIIRRSGENIAALEVEAVLSRHPALQALAVTPVPDEIRGEEVMACIVLDPAYLPSETLAHDVFEHALAALAYFKTPGYVAFVETLPLTATQKPKRNEIKTFARELLASPAAQVYDLRALKRKPAA